MGHELPDELLLLLRSQWRFRDSQNRQLTSLLVRARSAPPTLVAYGLESTGKTSLILTVLQKSETSHAYINCKECVTARQLLRKTVSACLAAAGKSQEWEKYSRCDHISTLAVYLQEILGSGRHQKFVLVLDGVDHQRGAPPTLLPALARLGDIVPTLSVVLILRSPPRPLIFQKSGVLYIHFPPYTRHETISIVANDPPAADTTPPVPLEEGSLARWYALFVTTVYDALFNPTSRSLPLFRAVCLELWPRFIAPFVAKEKPPGDNARWTFSKLVVRNRAIFQRDGEYALEDCIIPHLPATTSISMASNTQTQEDTSKAMVNESSTPEPSRTPFIPYLPALILVSAYLASHTSPRFDLTLFSKVSTSSRKATRHRKRKMLQSPAKTAQGGTPSSLSHRVPKSSIAINADLPRPFPLERLLAILRGIHPSGVRKRPLADQVYPELSTLEKLRLVVPASGGPGAGMADVGERWRVNVDRDWVGDVASRFGIRLDEWAVDDGG